MAGALVIADAGAGFHNATTNGSGQFSYASLPPGTYHMQASKSPYAITHYWGVVVGSSGTSNVTFTFRPGGGSIAGTVVDGGGNPIAGATVDAWQLINGQYDDGSWGRATTNGSGAFTISAPTTQYGLPSGTYFLKASKTGTPDGVKQDVPVTAGQQTTGVGLKQVSGSSSLLGRIHAAGGGVVPGARVYLDGPFGTALAVSDANGDYGIGGLPSGAYHVVITAAGYASAHEYGVEVPDHTIVAGKDFTLSTTAGTLTGTVTSRSTGLPVAGATVLADSDQGTGWGHTTTQPDGTFVLDGLAPMQYYLHADCSGYAGQIRTVMVTAATTGGNDFALGVANSAIGGRVTSNSGPAAGAQVFINSSAGATETVASSCVAGNDGRYSCDGLSGGDYDVHISGVLGFTNQVRFFVHVDDNSTRTDVDFLMTNGHATIRGTVRDPVTNAPIAGAKVQTFLEDNPGTWGNDLTDADGHYQVANLWGGNYLVTAEVAGQTQQRREHVPVALAGVTIVNLPDDGQGGTGSALCTSAAQVSNPAAVFARVWASSGGQAMLRGTLPGVSFDPTTDGVTVAAIDSANTLACVDLAASDFRRRHGGGFLYRGGRASSGTGITRLDLRPLGTGGMSVVLRARDLGLRPTDGGTFLFGFGSGSATSGGEATLAHRRSRFAYP